MKKLAMITMAAVLASTSLFANGAQESKTQGSDSATLRMSWWGGDVRHTATLNTIEAFEKANPNITVEGEYSGWDGYYQKIVTQLAGETAADIIQIDQPWLSELSSKDQVFAEITPDMVDLSQFDANFLKNYCTYDGKLLGLPGGTNADCLLIDKKMLSENGIDPATIWTWDNMVTFGTQIHETNSDNYLLNTDPVTFATIWFEIYLSQVAGHLVNADKTIGFTEAQAEQTFTYFKQWFDKGVVEPFSKSSLYFNNAQENPTWVNGNTAIYLNWVSTIPIAANTRSSIDPDTAAIPVMDNALNTGVLCRPSQIFTIYAKTKNKDASVKLLNYIFENEEAIKILGTCRGVPSTSKGREVLSKNNLLSTLLEKATNEGIAQAGDAQNQYEMNSNIIQNIQDVCDEFGYGKLSPHQAAQKLVSTINETLTTI